MSLVLDSSVTLAWIFLDEQNDVVRNVLDTVTLYGAVVPSLWRLEIANALQIAVRHKRMDREGREISLRDLGSLKIAVDNETDARAWGDTLGLAERFGLTLYDATYLELAKRIQLPLASLDIELRAAGKKLGLTLLGK